MDTKGEEAPELNRRAVQEAWGRVRTRECFFVPCIDTKSARKIVLAMGYTQGKAPPEARIGIFRGRWGLLCYRSTPGVALKTEKPDWF
jgi:hypothetical protein